MTAESLNDTHDENHSRSRLAKFRVVAHVLADECLLVKHSDPEGNRAISQIQKVGAQPAFSSGQVQALSYLRRISKTGTQPSLIGLSGDFLCVVKQTIKFQDIAVTDNPRYASGVQLELFYAASQMLPAASRHLLVNSLNALRHGHN